MANSAEPDQLASDLNLHCLQRQGISWFSRTMVKEPSITEAYNSLNLNAEQSNEDLHFSCIYLFFFFFFFFFLHNTEVIPLFPSFNTEHAG